MRKIWAYIAMVFVGFSAGLVTMYKLMGDKVEVNIRRIKTKRGSSDIDIPINVEKSRKRAKKRRNGAE
jgi:hypothetical protein